MVRREITSVSRNLLMLFLALGVILFQGANAQLANVPHCSCSPLIYKWTLDFNRTCASTEISLGIGSGRGVASIECDITMVNTTDPIDLVPVALTSYQLIELSTDRLAPVKINSETNLYFQDGQHLALTSETAANPNLVSGGVKATMGAVNVAGHGIELSWLIRYSNECEVKPFEVGDSIGWAVLNKDSVAARDQTCILASEPPAFIPSEPPSFIPSESPTRTTTPSVVEPNAAPSPNPTRYTKRGKGSEYTSKSAKSQKGPKTNSKGSEYTSKGAKSQKAFKGVPTIPTNDDRIISKPTSYQTNNITIGNKESEHTVKAAKSQKSPKAIKEASDNVKFTSKPTYNPKKYTTSSKKGSEAKSPKGQKASTAIDNTLDNDNMTSKLTSNPKDYTATGKKRSKAKSTKSQKAAKTSKDGSYGKKRQR